VEHLPQRGEPGQIRASDADREQVAEMLREAAAHGQLTFAELDERLEQAYAARYTADLTPLTTDLVPEHAPSAVGSPAGSAPVRVASGPSASVAVMSGAKREGRWLVPAEYTAVAVMGSVDLDLRQARFATADVTIRAYAVMGGIHIVVREDMEVDVTGVGVMGGFDHRAAGPGAPDARGPAVRVTGLAVMGGVDVERRPLPAEQPEQS
jgi:hypothetical protein